MGKAGFILSTLLAFLPIGSSVLRAKDANSTGTDDFAADVIDYATAVISAALNKQPIPFPPAAITEGPKADVNSTPTPV